MVDEGFKLIRESLFGQVYYNSSRAFVRVVRTELPFRVEAIDGEVEGLLSALAGISLDKTALLLDVRKVMGRNDEVFEAASMSVRLRFIARFGRAAILVRTLAGKLQGQRFTREDNISQSTLVTDDLARALAFMAEWTGDEAV